jgi:ABC-type multidrug transport system ATPase subunit
MNDDATEVRGQDRLPTARQPEASFVAGERINDRYLLGELIGVGAFGQVFRARDELLGRDVAFKTITPSGRRDRKELLEEARTVARLDHPHIVPIYDVGIVGSTTWMAMKLIDGVGLDRVMVKDGTLPRDRALPILAQTAGALDHAHRRGIVHRDVKPSNILVSRAEGGADHAWLADFGIAKMLTGDTSTGESLIAGTPAYMAPEQITGKRVDARTDVFALSCVAVEALTGVRCFDGHTYSELVYQVVHDTPNGLAQVGSAAGPQIEAAIRRGLAKSPEDRIQTAEELMRLLTDQRPAPSPSLLRRVTQRQPATVWDGRYVLAAERLAKGYGWRKPVVRDVNLRIERGAIYALLGRNGSGKTTLIRTLLGIYRRDGGEVRVFGRDPQLEGPAILGRIGYVAETPPFYDTMRVGELLALLAGVYSDWDHGLAYSLLGRYKVPLATRIRALSRGTRTQLALIAALAHRPEFLVLDDPTLGLDAVVLDDFFEMLAETSRREGTTVFLASHNIAEVESIATNVGLFADGRIVLSDSLAGLRTRTREVTMTFADDVPPSIRAVSDFKTIRSSGRHVTGFVLDESSGAIERLKALQPASMQTRELSLKEIFVNFMRES